MTKKNKPRAEKSTDLNDPAEVFTTYDLNCSAALICAGFELLSVSKGNPRKALFTFKRADGMDGVIDLYWSDRLEVKARAYADTLKALKNRLYSE
jgi:hypothetical protein